MNSQITNRVNIDGAELICGDALDTLKTLESNSVHTIVTSPPYFGLCDYQVSGQYGLESQLSEYLEIQVLVFRECRRILVNGGIAWIVIGDSSNNYSPIRCKGSRRSTTITSRRKIQKNLREKELLGVPAALGAALREDGWLWRNSLVWDKITSGAICNSDTAPQTHETILQMGRFDARGRPYFNCLGPAKSVLRYAPVSDPVHPCPFPIGLASELLIASSEIGQTVLDPYAGSGTAAMAARRYGRKSIGVELSQVFFDVAVTRLDTPIKQLSLLS